MLRIFLAATLTLLVTGCGSSPPTPEAGTPASAATDGTPTDALAELDERLDLTDDQERSVRRALDAMAEALVVARRQPDISSRRAGTERARTEADARIAASLTAEQRAIFEEIRAEREPEYDPVVRQRLAELTRRLELTADQQTSIAPLIARQVAEIEPILDRVRRGGNRDEAQAEVDVIRERTDALILALLTEEQASDYQRIIDERGRGNRGRR